jgi:antitoxin VapB
MPQAPKAKVFTSGGSQVVVIPAEYRFSTDEVFIRRDPLSGGLILSEAPNWNEVFAALDNAGVPDDFMADRGQDGLGKRDEP